MDEMEGAPKRRKRSLPDEEEEENDLVCKLDKGAKDQVIPSASNAASRGSLMQALQEAQRGNKRVIALCKEISSAVDETYYDGGKTFHDPQLTEMEATLDASRNEIDKLVDIIKTKARGCPIYKLPPEIVERIFKLLNTDDLHRCRQTCRDWKIHLEREAIWQVAPIALSGTLTQIDAKWTRLLKSTPRPSKLSLILGGQYWEPQEKFERRFMQAMIVRISPFYVLNEVDCNVTSLLAAAYIWFHGIEQCTRLKVLRWKVSDPTFDPYRAHELLPLDITYRPLARCRLEELKFESVIEVILDASFLQPLQQLKCFYHMRGLSRSHLLAILGIAEGHLEEVSLAGVGSHDSWNRKPTAIKESFRMSSLRRVSLLDINIGVLCIDAPKAEFIHFGHGELINTILLNSCRHHLKSLHIETNGVNIKETLGSELFDMHCLEELELDYTKRYQNLVLDPSDYSTAALWQVVESRNLMEAKVIFPSLKSLKITHDPLLDEKLIIDFLEVRSLLEQPPLEQMQIYLANHCSDDTRKLRALRRTTPGFKYQRYDDWKQTYVRQWSLKTSLSFSPWDQEKDWKMVNNCRRYLKELVIQISEREEADFLKSELFNMPQLNKLELNFDAKASENANAAALWNVALSGSTGKDGVLPQDIMPKLKRLTVENDSVLDADTIIKFIEMRERLGLAPIEEMTILFAQICTKKNTAKLKLLKKKMPGFTYRSKAK